MSEMLTVQDYSREDAFLADLPFLNWGALFMAPIWGFAHGDWPAILFYPLWIFCDNLLYTAWASPSVMSVLMAVLAVAIMAVLMVGYARVSSPRSAHRAAERGKTLEEYLRTEKRWAIGMALIAIVMLIVATWYNLCVRPGLG